MPSDCRPALNLPELSPRELAVRFTKAHDLITAGDLSTVLDASLATSWPRSSGQPYGAEDIPATLDLAISASRLDHITVVHRPRLLSDSGSSYVAGDLVRWLEDKGHGARRGAPYHRQTEGNLERWHHTPPRWVKETN